LFYGSWCKTGTDKVFFVRNIYQFSKDIFPKGGPCSIELHRVHGPSCESFITLCGVIDMEPFVSFSVQGTGFYIWRQGRRDKGIPKQRDPEICS
jgi:hypothetical protein